jgi:hypothetical protein
MKVDHVALKSNSIEKSIKWYKDFLSAFDIEYQDDTWGFIKYEEFIK